MVWRILGMALGALWAFKLRSFFVVLAVALGIAALTIIIASVDGARRKALEIVEWFGPDAVLVFGGNIETRAVGQRTLTLTWDDAQSIERSLPGTYMVVPMRSKSSVTLRFENRNMVTPVVVGATADYAQAWNWPLAEGRDLTEDDVKHSAKVCIIGDYPAKELFGDESPIGQVILVQDLPVQVIGRLAYRGFSPGSGGVSVDDRIIMPLSTLTQRFHLERRFFRALRVKFIEPELMDDHMENLRSLLRYKHKLKPEDPDDFSILSASEILKFLTMITGGIMVFLGITAGAAIVVGGFVLANLLFLSVSERQQEIGLKKAMGATSAAITVQFLSEAVLLTLVGALIGIGIGVGMGQLLAKLGFLEIQLSVKLFVLALLAAIVIALVFGLKPARKAASLDPIEALRGGE
jgi:putative ABC transport system permease protein